MTATDPVRNPDLRLGQLNALAGLLPYLWPAGRRDLKARVAVALVFLVLAKLATVVVPLVLRQAVDALTPAGATETAAGLVLVLDRKSVVQGKSVSVRLDLGGRRIIKKKNNNRRER